LCTSSGRLVHPILLRGVVSIQHVPVRDIVPNPYRKIESYGINEEKIEALIQSYDSGA